jgi:orotate phosphoribosyltransferase
MPTLPTSNPADQPAYPKDEFLGFAETCGVLRFGTFVTKSGRPSPYFFNTGDFNSGTAIARLGEAYADALLNSGVKFDMLFGPAYKGITLSAATAIGLSGRGLDVPFCYNRKEAKDHGEGGLLVGAPLAGRVVIVDDVITDGAAKRESVQIIRAAGAEPTAVLIALDRGERVTDSLDSPSAVQAFQTSVGVPVITIANVDDVTAYLSRKGDSRFSDFQAITAHLERYRAV